MAAEGDHIIRFNYTGEDDEVPHDATHVTASVRVIPDHAFQWNRNIIEVICDVNVKGVEESAFVGCPVLRRVIMPGVEVVEEHAFSFCEALTDVECGKLEIIKVSAFKYCESLRSINLPSARIVERSAFNDCFALTDVTFDSKLERIEVRAFDNCPSLERITIPLKDDMIADDNIFPGCDNLKQVDLVEGNLHETIAALQLEQWRNDMNEEIYSINQILPTTPAGSGWDDEVGGKARAIRGWIRSVLGKIVRYKAQHQHVLDEAATSLQLALPQDIVMKNVLPFLELPSYTFEVADHEEEEYDTCNLVASSIFSCSSFVIAAEGENMRWYNYTGDRRVPDDATHVTVSVTVISAWAFSGNHNIVEVVCDVNVEKIETWAFNNCPSLRRVIMPGVEVIERGAFDGCESLTDVECGKLEIIKVSAFKYCESLRSINLPSAKIVEEGAFNDCFALTDVTFDSKLERIEEMAFDGCPSLERITIPLKEGLMNDDDIFTACDNLKHVDLAGGELHETIAALQLEEWRNDMNEEINSINQILPNTPAGGWDDGDDEGEKALAIRTWIRSVLDRIIRYKAQHQHLLDEAATSLQLVLPQDIVMNNVLPFLDLPSYTFEVVDEEE
ncbi:leucine-rich repeat domain-containing protein [Skeletonema marinoi]|uniref:Leucine-rich repeat domain-containing protein n=1 Tax=Skeletonema marinoi TaxID=267567 RepID=A0AAD8Y1B9_9STRA|nr:leucine-rich repeat domain-containing protein [Skeletonema marinoi]